MSAATAPSSPGLLGEARALMRARPFEVVLGTWGSVLVATGAFLWRRQIPFQLKVIQARILAQASLVSGAMVFGALSLSAEAPAGAAEAAPGTQHQQWMLRNFAEVGEGERGRPAMGRHSRAAELEAAAAARAASAAEAEAAAAAPAREQLR
jgi:hypothetical protein